LTKITNATKGEKTYVHKGNKKTIHGKKKMTKNPLKTVSVKWCGTPWEGGPPISIPPGLVTSWGGPVGAVGIR